MGNIIKKKKKNINWNDSLVRYVSARISGFSSIHLIDTQINLHKKWNRIRFFDYYGIHF